MFTFIDDKKISKTFKFYFEIFSLLFVMALMSNKKNLQYRNNDILVNANEEKFSTHNF